MWAGITPSACTCHRARTIAIIMRSVLPATDSLQSTGIGILLPLALTRISRPWFFRLVFTVDKVSMVTGGVSNECSWMRLDLANLSEIDLIGRSRARCAKIQTPSAISKHPAEQATDSEKPRARPRQKKKVENTRKFAAGKGKIACGPMPNGSNFLREHFNIQYYYVDRLSSLK